jgi:hypothetical protein
MGALDTIVLLGILGASLAVVPLLDAGGVKLAMTGLVIAVAIGTLLGVRPLVRADKENAARTALLRPRVELLEALDLLSAAPRSLLERLAASVQEIIAEPGATLMRQGDTADFLWIVVSGSVRVATVSESGSESLSVDLGAHSYVGEIGLLHGVRRTATVTVTSPSELWRIPAQDFRNALAEVGSSTSLRSVSLSRYRQVRATPVPAPPSAPAADSLPAVDSAPAPASVDEDATYTL